MIRKFFLALLILSFLITSSAPNEAYAGGSGGEPLMSDAVGWGIVGALVIVGLYAVYKTKWEKPPSQESQHEKNVSENQLQTETTKHVSDNGNLLIAAW
jgi:hypothetical protein